MAVKIAIANQKGGVGKTTTALNIADALKRKKKKVLFIDLDPQCNSTASYGAVNDGVNSLYDIFEGKCSPEDAIQSTKAGDIIPGDPLLVELEHKVQTKIGGFLILKKEIKKIEDKYDYIIMDTPPNLGVFMLNALTASDGVIIPLKAEKYAIDGLNLLISTVNDVVENTNEDLKVYGVVLTAYDQRTSLDKQIWELLPSVGAENGFPVFKTPIRICQTVKDAQAQGIPLFELSASCNAAKDYTAVVKELEKKIKEK